MRAHVVFNPCCLRSEFRGTAAPKSELVVVVVFCWHALIEIILQSPTDLLDIDDITVTRRRIRIVRKLLERSAASFDSLSISFCVFKDAAAQRDLSTLIQNTDCVKSLTFTHNELQGDATLTFLMESLKGKRMDEIELNDRSIYGEVGGKFLKGLVKNVSMKRLRLKYMSFDPPTVRGLCSALRSTCCTVRELTLRECWVDDEMLAMIVECLCRSPNSSLSKLDLESNSFSPVAVPSLTRLLRNNKSIEKLILDRNENIFFGADDATAADFSNALAANTTLRFLSLTLTDLGDTMAIPLFRALETNKTLANLDIEDTFVSVYGYTQFVRSLPFMRGLREVTVGWDDLFDEFPDSLKAEAMEGIKRNESITNWYEVAMCYNDDYRTILPFYFARNRQMIKARKILQSPALEENDAAWKLAVPRMGRHASASSAVFEILRHCLPSHKLLPVTPLPNSKEVATTKMPSPGVMEEFETTSWTDWSGEDEFMAQVLDQEDVMGPQPAVAIAYPVYSR